MNPLIELSFASHVADLMMKVGMGEPGRGEKYMPWYGAAGLGALGQTAGTRLAPGKFKALGGLAGALAGTGIGVHAGEAVGKAMDKRAAEEPPAVEKPDYNKTLRRIAMRQAGTTAKEIGAVALPLAAGMGTGFGIQKYMERTGRSAAPAARKILAFSAIPAVGMTAGAMYRTAKHLKDQEFDRIRQEEMDSYNRAVQSYERGLKRSPQPEGT